MPWVTANGPPPPHVLTHMWTPGSGPSPPVLGDKGDVSPAELPYVKVLSVKGWRSSPEIEDNRDPRTAGEGEFPYPIRVLGKPLVYKCEVWAENIWDVTTLINQCALGFTTNQSDEGVMTLEPYSGYGGTVWTFGARVIDFDPDEEHNHSWHRVGKFRWGFLLSLRMSNRLFYTGGVGYP